MEAIIIMERIRASHLVGILVLPINKFMSWDKLPSLSELEFS